MVTLIIDKLKNQSLEDLPSEEKVGMTVPSFAETNRNKHLDYSVMYKTRVGRQPTFGHTRTRSYPQNQPRRVICRATALNSSSVMQSAPMPPATKKLRRSLSVPEEDSAISLSSWAPKASAIWQPVRNVRKQRSESCPDDRFRLSSEPVVNSISTPPASPTPRPASANAALDGQGIYLKEGLVVNRIAAIQDRKRSPSETQDNPHLLPLQRSQSQPCFDRARSCGVKRRREEVDANGKLRPALDLAKMEETSYWRFRDRKKCLRIPKYMNKKPSEGLTPFFIEPEKFSIKPIKSTARPLCAHNSSIMITPTSSPTKNLDCADLQCEDAEKEKLKKGLENLKEKSPDEGVFHLDYDSELDLNSIEEDEIF